LEEQPDARPRAARFTAVALLLAASVLLSRVLGFVREMVLARQLGAGTQTDAYYAAFQIPDILNYFLAGGALSIAFIPFYTRMRGVSGDAAAERLFAVVLGTTTAVAVAATALLWWQADALVRFQFRGFTAETQQLTARLTRIVLPAQILFVAGGIVRAVLMAHDRFATQALAPLLYNLGIIVGGVTLGGVLGAEGFAWGALAGAALGPLLVPLIDAHRAGLRVRLRVDFLDRAFWRYLAVAAPLMFGLSLLTVDEWYDRWFGALLEEGTVAQLGFARRLMLLPVAVVGQGIATAALPTLSRLWSEGRREELDRTLLDTLRVGLGLALIAAAACFAFAGPVVELVYERGRFTRLDSIRVASLLAVFALAVPAWITQQIALRGFYARGDTWRPMLLSTAVALAAAPLYWRFGPRYGAEGLAAAGVIAMSANAALTLGLARALHGAPHLGRLLLAGARGAAIALLAAFAGLWVLLWRAAEPDALADFTIGGLAFGAVAAGCTFLFGDAPLRRAMRRTLARLRPTGVYPRSRGESRK
jgi:putative peptidoglycan lipid II flippase